jgi:hypothetical protein
VIILPLTCPMREKKRTVIITVGLILGSTKSVVFFTVDFFFGGGGGAAAQEPPSVGCGPVIRNHITSFTRHWCYRNSWHNDLLASSFALGKPWMLLPRHIDRRFVIQAVFIGYFLLPFGSEANTLNTLVVYTVTFEWGQVRNISSS